MNLDKICEKILAPVGGELNAESMQHLNGDQITLVAYKMLRDEVMEGGFIQLIHNGLGAFIFLNPFAKAMRLWGQSLDEAHLEGGKLLHDFSNLIYKGRKLYEQHSEALTQPCNDDEFMALYEQYPDFDELDDTFVEAEDEITAAVLRYAKQYLV